MSLHPHHCAPCTGPSTPHPAVLTFLLRMRNPEHRHGVELGACSVRSIAREGSWSKGQGPGVIMVVTQPSPC